MIELWKKLVKTIQELHAVDHDLRRQVEGDWTSLLEAYFALNPYPLVINNTFLCFALI